MRGKNRGQDASCYADANFLNGILAAADDVKREVFFQLYWIEISLQKMLERDLDGSESERKQPFVRCQHPVKENAQDIL